MCILCGASVAAVSAVVHRQLSCFCGVVGLIIVNLFIIMKCLFFESFMGYPLGSFVWEHLLYTLLTETARELVGAWSVSSGMGFVVPVYWLLL